MIIIIIKNVHSPLTTYWLLIKWQNVTTESVRKYSNRHGRRRRHFANETDRQLSLTRANQGVTLPSGIACFSGFSQNNGSIFQFRKVQSCSEDNNNNNRRRFDLHTTQETPFPTLNVASFLKNWKIKIQPSTFVNSKVGHRHSTRMSWTYLLRLSHFQSSIIYFFNLIPLL